MDSLGFENCVRVDSQTRPLSAAEAVDLLAVIPGWQIIDRGGMPALQKLYKLSNFNLALSFTNRIGQQAEDQDHHPAILTEWGRVTVTWWTHVVHGLHRNDFIMAARTDLIYEEYFKP